MSNLEILHIFRSIVWHLPYQADLHHPRFMYPFNEGLAAHLYMHVGLVGVRGGGCGGGGQEGHL